MSDYKVCKNCTHCRPITRKGYPGISDITNLFNKWGEPQYCACTHQKGQKYMEHLHLVACPDYEARPITEKDIAWWGKMLPLRWKELLGNKYVTLQIIATEEVLEITYKYGNRDEHWFFKVGELAESASDAFATIDTDRYNQERVKQMAGEPSERSYWSDGKCDKEIGGDGINPYAEQLRY